MDSFPEVDQFDRSWFILILWCFPQSYSSSGNPNTWEVVDSWHDCSNLHVVGECGLRNSQIIDYVREWGWYLTAPCCGIDLNLCWLRWVLSEWINSSHSKRKNRWYKQSVEIDKCKPGLNTWWEVDWHCLIVSDRHCGFYKRCRHSYTLYAW